MWFLSSKHSPKIIYVLPGKEIIIGRSADEQNCNFAVPDDPSLSRKHASLSIADTNLILCDLGSKYGSFVNHSTDKLAGNEKLTLNVNDHVKFGKMNCEWEVNKMNFVTCTSTLKGENIQNLKNTIEKLGGVLKTEWDDSCTHLTMPAITLTIKVVLALVQGSFIVQIDYWNKCLEAISHNTKLPEPGNFTPQIIESTLNKENVSFLPHDARKTLFTGKNVIFFSKRQMEMYRMVLEKSSATATLLSETKMTKSMLCAENVIVIQYSMLNLSQETEAQREQIKDIVNYLRSKGKRVVADAEIGLAILFCSMEKYCNPDFNIASEVIKQPDEQTTKVNNILAQDTQTPLQTLVKTENVKIDESLTTPTDISIMGSGENNILTSKRKLAEDDVTCSVNKKMAVMDPSHLNNAGIKRPADTDIQSTHCKKMAVESTADDDSFNFIKSSNKKDENSSNSLNLMKPIKRKIEQQDDEEGLFNFVKKKAATEPNAESNLSHDPQTIQNNDSDPEVVSVSSTSAIDDKVDIKSLRGAKLSELMAQNSNMEINNKIMKVVKTENDDNDDFGSTVVDVRSDLIVKKEPLYIKEASEPSLLKNFKKFKKVWPLKIQASMSKLSLSGV